MVQVEYRSEGYLGLHILNTYTADAQGLWGKRTPDHALDNLWPVSGAVCRRFEFF